MRMQHQNDQLALKKAGSVDIDVDVDEEDDLKVAADEVGSGVDDGQIAAL